MAVHLSDIVVRRTGLGGAGHPGADVLSACAQIAAAELGWSEQRQQEEAASVADIYAIP
jgi:glycerol-3-phosphate dehydrogenase